MNRLFLLAALAVAVYSGVALNAGTSGPQATAGLPVVAPVAADHGDAILDNAFRHRLGNLQVAGQGTVVKLLQDDSNGSRHQRFIIRLGSGQSVLVAHNIDLAQRVDSLRQGDMVAFYGEYEWNAKGGVIHWTHRDPQGRHPAGWLRHGGQTYQ